MKCRNCTNLHLIRECKNLLWCDDVLDAPDPDAERECKYFKHATHADRIRAMTDEGIEDWYWWMHKEMMRYTDSRVFVHDWLKSPAEEVEG